MNFSTFANSGGLAQLARAFDWQSRGQGFDSPRLHKKPQAKLGVFLIMVYYVYILYSIHQDRFYIGQTKNKAQRIRYHNSGQVSSTKPYRLWEMVWHMEFKTRAEAMDRERKLKNLKSQLKISQFMLKKGVLNTKSSPEFFAKIRGSS